MILVMKRRLTLMLIAAAIGRGVTEIPILPLLNITHTVSTLLTNKIGVSPGRTVGLSDVTHGTWPKNKTVEPLVMDDVDDHKISCLWESIHGCGRKFRRNERD
jgi:hypothetical protein